LLIVSKSFLYCSRRSKVYRLSLELPFRFDEEILGSVLNGNGYFRNNWFDSERFGFKLTLAKSKEFVRLFRPEFVGIKQGDHFIHRYVKELYEMLQFTDGKIGLFYHEKHDEICHLRLVEAFSSRIHELKCSGELLEDDSLPKLRLEKCDVFNLEIIGQLAKVLHHDIRKLTIAVNRARYLDKKELASIKESDEELQVINTGVEPMGLYCDELGFDEVKELASVILKFCPNLKNFYLYAAESQKFPEFFDQEFTARQALFQRQKIMELKQIFSTSRTKPNIGLGLTISSEENHDGFENVDYWYAMDEEEFVGWESYKGDRDFENSNDNMTEEGYYFGYTFYPTYLEFEDEQCKLDLDITNRVYGMRAYNEV